MNESDQAWETTHCVHEVALPHTAVPLASTLVFTAIQKKCTLAPPRPIAADLKLAMRETSKHDGKTFAPTADASEAHRQTPTDEKDWHGTSWVAKLCMVQITFSTHWFHLAWRPHLTVGLVWPPRWDHVAQHNALAAAEAWHM